MSMIKMHHSLAAHRRGTAMLSAVTMIMVLSFLATSMLMGGLAHHNNTAFSRDLVLADAAAMDGVEYAVAGVLTQSNPETGATLDLGYTFDGYHFRSLDEGEGEVSTAAARTARHYVNVYTGDVDGLDNDGNGIVDDPEELAFLLIDSLGLAGKEDRAARVLRATALNVILPFRNAIYAGNSSKDPTYDLPLRGTGTDKDLVYGNVYSSGSATADQDAYIDGKIRAGETASVSGGATTTGDVLSNIYQPLVPLFTKESFSGLQEFHEISADTYGSDPLAQEIFELNPTTGVNSTWRREAQVNGTELNDFFLENNIREGTLPGGVQHTDLVLHEDGNQVVYHVDGNLWLNSKRTYGFDLQTSDGSPAKVTFVVAGNIYLSDNLFYDDPESLAAFIAIENPSLSEATRSVESGNIVIGDPIFGTLEDFSGLLYAQNDFIDNNLTAEGSQEFKITGAMTARNQVNIERDYQVSGVWHHSKMTVDHDERVFDPAFQLSPGIDALVGPRSPGDAITLLSVDVIGVVNFEARDEWNDLPNSRQFGDTRGEAAQGY